MEPELLQPPSPSSLVSFSLICSRGGGSIAAAVTFDIVADESRNNMADGVTRSPARLCSRVGKICCYERLEYDFLLLCLASYFSYFLLPYPGMFYLLRVPSSVQQQSSATVLSASTYLIVRALSCVICILPHLGIPLFLFV